MDVSVIIPVHDDVRIKRCVESIDEDVEIIASMNCPTEEVERVVEDLGIEKCVVGERSISKAYNKGIDKSSREHVLFMDSDCVFIRGCLSKMYEKMNTHRIAKGNTRFAYNSFMSKIISRAREFTTSESPQLYIPLVMIHKSIFNEVGYFNEKIEFIPDCDFSDRVKARNIDWIHVPDAQIIHDPLSIFTDLRSGFKYGIGRSQKHRSRGDVKKPDYVGEMRDYLIRGAREKGVVTGLYLAGWYVAFTTGFLYQERKSSK